MANKKSNQNQNQNTDDSIDVVPVKDPTTQDYDAEEMKAAIAEGEEQAPKSVNVSADYEAAKQMSTGRMNQQEAEKSVAPEQRVKSADQVSVSTSSANQAPNYKDMAKDVNAAPTSPGNVTDDLVEKALEKGEAAGS